MLFTTSTLWTAGLFTVASASLSPIEMNRRETTCNDEGFTLCPPNAPATSTGGGSGSGGPYVPPYSLGPSPFEFITSIGSSVSAAASKRQEQEQFCCNPRLECRILTDYQDYICLDNATSDFFMNDGSNGNAESGMYYNAPAGANINIFTGDYVFANGTRGNGYDDTGSPRPSREVTGSIPQPTGDVVRDTALTETAGVTSMPTAASTTRGGATTSATSAGASSPTKTLNSAGTLYVPGWTLCSIMSGLSLWYWL